MLFCTLKSLSEICSLQSVFEECIWIGFLQFSIWKYVFDIAYLPFHATDVVLVLKNKGELS